MPVPVRVMIIGIRLAAVAVVAIVVPLLWKALLWLPWQADCGIAAASAFAFAYVFEREDVR
jgi:hypothetical protein